MFKGSVRKVRLRQNDGASKTGAAPLFGCGTACLASRAWARAGAKAELLLFVAGLLRAERVPLPDPPTQVEMMAFAPTWKPCARRW